MRSSKALARSLSCTSIEGVDFGRYLDFEPRISPLTSSAAEEISSTVKDCPLVLLVRFRGFWRFVP